MTISTGKRIGAAGSLPFFAAVFNEMYQRFKAYSYPTSPDAARGYIFRESADMRGNLIHYVPADLHHLIAMSSYATEAMWLRSSQFLRATNSTKIQTETLPARIIK